MKNSILQQQDQEIYSLIQKEIKRQQDGLIMIPSENYASPAVFEAMGTALSNKYSEGYPGKRYYTGNEYIDQIENLAIDRAKKLFNAEHANVQPNAGSGANLAVYMAFLNPGDKILGLKLSEGGHLTHGHPVNFSGKTYNFIQYGVDRETERINMDEVRRKALKEKPKMIVVGATAYPREFNFKAFREIADEIGAFLFADISHFVGLCIAGIHQDAIPYSDVVMTTTHKTLRGPRSAIILCKEKYVKKIDSAIFPGTQGGPMNHIIAAKAVCFKEAMLEEFKNYQRQIVKNAKILAQTLMENGLRIVSNGTDNHLMLIDCRKLNILGKQGANALAEANIYTNFNTIPYDPNSAFNPSGIRLGTPALTTRGFKEEEMKTVGKLIADILKNIDNENLKQKTKQVINALTEEYPIYQDLIL